MNLQKEDITNIDSILEMYVKDDVSQFNAIEISTLLSTDYSYAQFLIAQVNRLNDELSLFRCEIANSGNIYPLTDGKFLVKRFLDNGGYQQYLDEKQGFNEIADLSQKIDVLLSGQIMLLKGQSELDENGESRILELKELLIPILLKKTPFSEVVKAQVISAFVALEINPENLESLVNSIQNSIDI